jgi:membrane-associated phospholipid phosphatase
MQQVRHHWNLVNALLWCITVSATFCGSPVRADGVDLRAARVLTSPSLLIYTGAGVVLPLIEGGKRGKTQSLRTVDALIVSALVETALKRIVREQRPGSRDKHSTDFSFPSGHAMAAFTTATMQSHYHPKQAPLWYTGAVLIAASRVRLRRHYVHDVIAGAALGYVIARIEVSHSRGLLLSPFIRSDARETRANRGHFMLQISKAF